MGKARPGGGRPPGRRGRGGVGPGPGYRPGPGKGTSHKGGKTGGGMCAFGRLVGAIILACFAASLVGISWAAL